MKLKSVRDIILFRGNSWIELNWEDEITIYVIGGKDEIILNSIQIERDLTEAIQPFTFDLMDDLQEKVKRT